MFPTQFKNLDNTKIKYRSSVSAV